MSFGNEFLHDFNERFDEFRTIEFESIEEKRSNTFSLKSFSLLEEIELCYASGAYIACIILACSAIEASLSKGLNTNARTTLAQLIDKSGYIEEINWLRELRNDLIHKAECTEIIDLCFSDIENVAETKNRLKDQCKHAFKLMHIIHFSPIKQCT